jgi:adenylate cyclase
VRVGGGGQISLGGTTIPTDRRGRLPVNYYGGEGSFQVYSAESVIMGEVAPEKIANKVVLVGGTADIAVEFVGTPFAESLPAVETEATVVANILARDFLREASPAANLLFLLAAGAAVPFVPRRRAVLSLLSLLGLAVALVAVNVALFLRGHLFALAYPLALLLAAGGALILHQHLREVRVARRMRRLFSSYVTERVLEQLIADPAMARQGGERREVTILFTDIRGFMAFSEKHQPEEVVRTLNEYLEAMTEVVFRWEGTLDKFIGDSILAFWGAPLPQEDHAERALRCALHMCARLGSLNAAWVAAGRQPLEIGIGITTGQVLVGNIGAEGKKMDYTVIGDQVNLCSRVEELTKEFRARILITADTFAQVRPLLAARSLGHVAIEGLAAVAVKGKEEPVRLYRVSPLGHGEPSRVEESGAAAPGP